MRKIAIFLILLTACTNPQIIPQHMSSYKVHRIETARIYKQWFGEVKECLDISSGRVESVKFYSTLGMRNSVTLELIAGVHYEGNIVLATVYVNDRNIVKHEMVHWLLYYNTGDGDARHEHEGFRECVE